MTKVYDSSHVWEGLRHALVSRPVRGLLRHHLDLVPPGQASAKAFADTHAVLLGCAGGSGARRVGWRGGCGGQ